MSRACPKCGGSDLWDDNTWEGCNNPECDYMSSGVALVPDKHDGIPGVIECTPVLSFQCPKCDMVMMREPNNDYRCISKDCVYNDILWRPETWEMIRVK